MRVGFIGMGLMGVPMSRRLQRAGFDVMVWNRNKAKSDAARASCEALKVADTVRALVGNTDVVMLCVSDTTAVCDVVFAEGGVAQWMRQGQVLVDFSSIDPAATRDMAARLLAATGGRWVDAPVSGGVAGAEQGTLAIMAGGRSEDITAVAPLLEPLSQRVTRMGDVGAGQVTKICNQMLVTCNVMAMAEVIALAERAGVDATRIPEALKGGFADSTPLQLTGARMAAREFEPVKWHVRTLLKDLDMAGTLAAAVGAEVPMAERARALYRAHGRRGRMDADPSTLVDMYAGGAAPAAGGGVRVAVNVSLMYCEHPFLERFAAAKRDGFEAVEIQFPYDHAAGEVQRALRASGLRCVLINVPAGDLTAGGEGLAAVPGREAAFDAALEQCAVYAQALEVSCVNVLPGRCKDAAKRPEYLATYKNSLRKAAARLSPLGITTTLEAINTRDLGVSSLVSTAREMFDIVDELRDPRVKAQYDVYHMALMHHDVCADIKRHAAAIGHIQFSDIPHRGEPGSGLIDFAKVFAAIASSGYRGWTAAEYKPTSPTPTTLQWRKLLPPPAQDADAKM